MENKSQRAAIKISNSQNIRFSNGQINGYDVGVDADGVKGLSMEGVEVNSPQSFVEPELEWYKDFKFLVSILVSITIAIIGWIFFQG